MGLFVCLSGYAFRHALPPTELIFGKEVGADSPRFVRGVSMRPDKSKVIYIEVNFSMNAL